MNTVFILGAGASRQAGGPLMSDFLDCAETLMRLKHSGITEAQDDFNNVFKAIAELQGVHSKSYLDLCNIEVVFGAIEMARLVGRLGERNLKEIIKLSESIKTLIYKTLENNIKFPVRDRVPYPPYPYDNFVEMLLNINQELAEKNPVNHKYSFITFNYDLALEFALRYNRGSYDYCLSGELIRGLIPYLKLHGSINWGICPACNKIIPIQFDEVDFVSISLFDYVYYKID